MDPLSVIRIWLQQGHTIDAIAHHLSAATDPWIFDETKTIQCPSGMHHSFAIKCDLEGPRIEILQRTLAQDFINVEWADHLCMAHRVGRADLRYFVASSALALTYAVKYVHRGCISRMFDVMCKTPWKVTGGTISYRAIENAIEACSVAVVAGQTLYNHTATKPPEEINRHCAPALIVDGWPLFTSKRDKALIALALLFRPCTRWCNTYPECAPKEVKEFCDTFGNSLRTQHI